MENYNKCHDLATSGEYELHENARTKLNPARTKALTNGKDEERSADENEHPDHPIRMLLSKC